MIFTQDLAMSELMAHRLAATAPDHLRPPGDVHHAGRRQRGILMPGAGRIRDLPPEKFYTTMRGTRSSFWPGLRLQEVSPPARNLR